MDFEFRLCALCILHETKIERSFADGRSHGEGISEGNQLNVLISADDVHKTMPRDLRISTITCSSFHVSERSNAGICFKTSAELLRRGILKRAQTRP